MNGSSGNSSRSYRCNTPLAVSAIVVYLAGGVFVFGGLVLAALRYTSGGAGLPVAIISVVIGLFLSMLGVLLMRIVRNRGRR